MKSIEALLETASGVFALLRTLDHADADDEEDSKVAEEYCEHAESVDD